MGLTEKIKGIGDKSLTLVKYVPAAVGGLVTILGVKSPQGRTVWDDVSDLDMGKALNTAKYNFLGYGEDQQIHKVWLKRTYKPIFVGLALSYLLGMAIDIAKD